MKAWVSEFKRAASAVILLSVLLGGIYPLAVWSIGQLLFPDRANGSLLTRRDGTVGSALIAQPFAAAVYFHSRPSAIDYACSRANSGGSNLGPLSTSLSEQVAARSDHYRLENGLPTGFPIPGDALSASASGLDPHISPANASAQAARVAKARDLDKGQVLQMIRHIMEDRQLGIFGGKRINVLLLNLALDGRKQW
jgi:K+-transporting ATPase ATPase C chain